MFAPSSHTHTQRGFKDSRAPAWHLGGDAGRFPGAMSVRGASGLSIGRAAHLHGGRAVVCKRLFDGQ